MSEPTVLSGPLSSLILDLINGIEGGRLESLRAYVDLSIRLKEAGISDFTLPPIMISEGSITVNGTFAEQKDKSGNASIIFSFLQAGGSLSSKSQLQYGASVTISFTTNGGFTGKLPDSVEALKGLK